MGVFILFVVGGVGLFCLVISIVLYKAASSSAKSTEIKRNARFLTLVLTPIFWIVIFALPIDYGSSGSNYDIVVQAFALKTAAFLFTPAVIMISAVFILNPDAPETQKSIEKDE